MKLFITIILVVSIIPSAHATEIIENFLGMRFVKIPAGEFTMGTADITAAIMEIPDAKNDSLLEETPAHTVAISRPFHIGETEVTQAQWLKVMENRPGPEANWKHDNWEQLPVVSVSWLMAKRFIE